MVTIYPMLISQAVSENVIPGIAKTLESYIMVYNMNDVISSPMGPRQINYKIKAGKIFAKEGEDLSEGVPPGVQAGKGKTKPQLPPPPDDEDEEEAKKAGKTKPKISSTNFGSITLEPSYITVDVMRPDGTQGTEFIGVKVVPLRVKSDAKLLDMLMYDHQMRFFQSLMVSQGRKILRYAYKLIGKWTGRVSSPPTGDVRQDVVLGRSGFKGIPFIVVDKGQDFNEAFFSKPARINRLFKMGWGNIVIVDSINRQAYFCLKQLRGTCSILSFSMIYQNLGQLKVYESLEDIKRQNSSLFKMGPRISKVLGECMSDIKQDKYTLSEDKEMNKIDTYLEQLDLREELELVQEIDLKDFSKKLNLAKLKGIASKLKNSFDIKNPNKIIKAVKSAKIPSVKPSTIDKIIGSKVPTYKKNKASAKVVLKNSLGKANELSIDAAATFIALKSMYKKKDEKDNPNGILKRNIKEFVLKARKFQSEYESLPENKERAIPKDVLADYAIGATIVVLAIALAAGVGSGVYLILSSISTLIWPVLPIAAGILLVGYVVLFLISAKMGGR